jgi:RHS repeat-associated protein
VVTGFTYDAINRIAGKNWNDGVTPAVTYFWDTPFRGRMHRVSSSASVNEYLTFDAMGRVLTSRQTTNGTAYNMSYLYNAAGALSQETYPGGRIVTTCYDEAGRIAQVKSKPNAQSTETTVASVQNYAPHGAVSSMSLGNSAGVVTEQWAYNNRLQATQLTAGAWQMKLFYCASQASTCTSNNGNILRQEGFGGASWDYQYDEYNRLKWAEEKVAGASKWHQQFLFDAFGNRRLLNDVGTLIPNQMMTPRVGLVGDSNPFNTANNQWTGAEYYPNGNQKTAWGNGTDVGSAKYFYDGENRMRQADVNWPGSGTITTMEYGYDGEGRRVLRKVGGAVRTVWVYDAMGQMIAEHESGTVAAPSCGGPCYLTADHLGSTRVVWGGDGAIKQLRDYAPFGEEVVSTFRGDDARYPTVLYPRSGTQSLPVEFTGKERDAETGLDYFGARYFASAQGRFSSPDPLLGSSNPLDPQSWNRYTYGLNNPLRYIDPLGLYEWDATLGGSATDAELRKQLSKKDANKIIDRRNDIRKAITKGVGSKDADVAGAYQTYGVEGDANGVTIASQKPTGGGVGAAGQRLEYVNGTFRSKSLVSIDPNQSGNDLFMTLAHEGTHVRDGQAYAAAAMQMGDAAATSPFNLTVLQTEMNAYTTSVNAVRTLGMPNLNYSVGSQTYQIWKGGTAPVDRPVLQQYLRASPLYAPKLNNFMFPR